MKESVRPGKRRFMIRIKNFKKDKRNGQKMPSGKLRCDRTRGLRR